MDGGRSTLTVAGDASGSPGVRVTGQAPPGRDPWETAAVTGPDRRELLSRTERWFLHRGLPHLIEDYRAREDVFTRGVGVLTLVALVEVVNAVRLEWRWWQNVLALVGGAALLVALFVAVNVARGRRPTQAPDDVGAVELGLFVLLPALVALAFGQVGSALLTAAGNVVLLLLVYVVAGYGLIPMTRWALGQTVGAVGAVGGLVGRALPLLFALTIFLFVNTEAWQVAAALPISLFVATGGLFVVVGLLFLMTRLPTEVRRLDDEVGDGGSAAACLDTPLEGQAEAVVAAGGDVERPLGRRQRVNVYLVLLFAQAVQVVLVALAVFVFFVVFGLVAVRPVVVDAWLGEIPSEVLVSGTVLGHPIELTTALLHVSGLMAFVAGFSFTVAMVSDATYREEFFADVVAEVRQALGVRRAYLALREATTATSADAAGGGVGPAAPS